MEFTGERYIPSKEMENQAIAREHWQRYIFSKMFFSETSEVVDVACGEGYGSNLLAESLRMVTGIDISEDVVEHAKKKYVKDNLKFVCADMCCLPNDDSSVDGIISFETIEHVEEEKHHLFLKETKRILKSSGVLIISCPNKKIASDFAYELWNYKNPFHQREYEIEEFRELLSQYYKYVFFLYQRTETNLVLSEKHPKTIRVLWGEKKGTEDTQNIIAICSDMPIRKKIENLIILDINQEYLKSQRNLSEWVHASNTNAEISVQKEKEKNILQIQLEHSQQMLSNHSSEIEHLEDEINRNCLKLEQQKSQFLKKEENLKAIILEKEASVRMIESKLQQRELELKKKQLELAEVKQNINELSKEIEVWKLKWLESDQNFQAVITSASWKVMAPLRCFADKMKQLIYKIKK